MRTDRYTRIVLSLIALFLGIVALRPWLSPPRAFAGLSAAEVYIEPGVHSLRAPDGSRNLLGKVVVDLRTGRIWGFPTNGQTPYPVNPADSQPPVSTPYPLGKFDFAAMDR
jgi:hypothetical protein